MGWNTTMGIKGAFVCHAELLQPAYLPKAQRLKPFLIDENASLSRACGLG
jgi:hypothetical protein